MAPPVEVGSDGLARSWGLLGAFRREQADPVGTYTLMGVDAARTISRFHAVAGATIVDVGGGPGFTAEALRHMGAHAFTVDPFLEELHLHDRSPVGALVGDGLHLPIGTASVDVCCSFNAVEHVADPWAFLDEVVRVVRPGGLVFIGVTNWLSPWGGHETSPWHYLGGHRAARRYEARRGRPPKNEFGRSLFRVDVAELLEWSKRSPTVDLVDAFPRYYPQWCRNLVKVPGVREVVTWNLGLALEKR
ncbi:MAG: class I SAM-dependent methyltransferase [Aquihabitans sp.]